MSGIFNSSFDLHIIEALEASKKSHARESMRSAIEHLRLAEPLFQSDVSMAVFRCLTAVEEAASSLMLLLQEKKYSQADRLRRTDHLYKNAMLPFIRILHGCIIRNATEKNFHIELVVHRHLQQSLGIAVITQHADGSSSMIPINPPLSLLLSEDGLGIDKVLDIDAFIQRQGASSVKTYLKYEKNFRNKLLYASPQGIPRISIDHKKYYPAKQQAVRTMLCAYLLIEPFGLQPTITHALNAYLDLIGLVESV